MVFGDPVIPSRIDKGQDTPCPSQSSDQCQSWLGCGGGAQFLRVASARALAQSLLERRATPGHDGPTPSVDDVIGDARHAGLA